jgi:autotransporter translocation and assembly factor TamB
MKWQLQGPELSKLAPRSGLRGSVSAEGSLQGPVSSLQSRTRLRIEELALGERPLGRCTLRLEAETGSMGPRGRWDLHLETVEGPDLKTEGDFRLRGGSMTVSGIRGAAASASFSGGGSLDLGTRNVQGSLRASLQNLSDLNPLLPAPLSGSARFEADIRGPMASPALQAELSAEGFGFRDYSARELRVEAELSDAAELRGSFSLRVQQAAAAEASIGELRLQGSGDRSEGEFDLLLRGSDPEVFFLDTGGTWTSGSAEGTVRLTSGQSSLQGLEASWSRPVRLHAARNLLELRAERINLAGAPSSLELSVQGETIRGNLSLQGLSLSDIDLQGVPRFRGTAEADLRLQGTLQAPVLRAECGVRNLKPASAEDGETPEASVRAVVTYENEEFRADLRLSGDKESELRSSVALPGTLSLRPATFRLQKEMDGSLRVDLDLETISRIFPLDEQHVEGRMQGRLDLSGAYAQPLLSGELEVSGGEYEHLRTGTVLKDIRLDLALQGRQILLRSLRATDGEDGRLTGKGRITFSEDFACDLAVHLEEAQLLRLDFARGTISGDVRYRASPGKSSLKGELSLFPLELSIPEQKAPGMEGLTVVEVGTNATQAEPVKKPQEKLPGLANPALDLEIRLPGGCYVRWRGLESEWEGRLTATGTAARPLVQGGMSLVRGHMNILTKRFTLESGTISFFKRYPPEPLINVTAVHASGDLKTVIAISGPADRPSITLSSEPPFPQEEILSRLLFGRELGEITPVQAVKLALAVRTLTGHGGEGFTERLRRFVFLDELDIRQSEEAGEGTVVGVGKYLNENIYFKVEQGADPESGQVSVEIEITPQISVETEAGAVNQGVDLKWQYRY